MGRRARRGRARGVGWAVDHWRRRSASSRDPALHAGEFNFGGYSNPALDQLIRRIAVETDLKDRDGLLHEALVMLRDDIAYVPLHRQALVWAASTRVELVQRADGSFPLRYVRIK